MAHVDRTTHPITLPLHSSNLCSMVEIFIQFFVLLQDRSKITKALTLWYFLISNPHPYLIWTPIPTKTCTPYVFDLLRRRLLDSNTSCQRLSFAFTASRVSSVNIISFAKSILQGIILYMSVNSSITNAKR